jgi:hypothetical protein
MKGYDVMSIVREQNAQRGYDNQARGQAFEFRVLRSFKRRSDVLFAIRSAGSHSAVDIIVQYKNGRQLWITCKINSYIEPKERLELSQVKRYMPANCELRLYYYQSEKIYKWARI